MGSLVAALHDGFALESVSSPQRIMRVMRCADDLDITITVDAPDLHRTLASSLNPSVLAVHHDHLRGSHTLLADAATRRRVEHLATLIEHRLHSMGSRDQPTLPDARVPIGDDADLSLVAREINQIFRGSSAGHRWQGNAHTASSLPLHIYLDVLRDLDRLGWNRVLSITRSTAEKTSGTVHVVIELHDGASPHGQTHRLTLQLHTEHPRAYPTCDLDGIPALHSHQLRLARDVSLPSRLSTSNGLSTLVQAYTEAVQALTPFWVAWRVALKTSRLLVDPTSTAVPFLESAQSTSELDTVPSKMVSQENGGVLTCMGLRLALADYVTMDFVLLGLPTTTIASDGNSISENASHGAGRAKRIGAWTTCWGWRCTGSAHADHARENLRRSPIANSSTAGTPHHFRLTCRQLAQHYGLDGVFIHQLDATDPDKDVTAVWQEQWIRWLHLLLDPGMAKQRLTPVDHSPSGVPDDTVGNNDKFVCGICLVYLFPSEAEDGALSGSLGTTKQRGAPPDVPCHHCHQAYHAVCLREWLLSCIETIQPQQGSRLSGSCPYCSEPLALNDVKT
ncbi:hypothetical protein CAUPRSCDRAFT_10403 [Caulochytrium protostelioides]|uniref:FANCL C-terminal domain-containing protein n=1 Tax=Caulochytrium protostelioides TaxID=1555241 RepID=A0A4P9WZW8_9FUNG|nr:hypothetical protein CAUPRSCDRAFT_10403 [Caulochytrium protostelioides]